MQGASGDDLMQSLHLVSGFRVHTSLFSLDSDTFVRIHTQSVGVSVSEPIEILFTLFTMFSFLHL